MIFPGTQESIMTPAREPGRPAVVTPLRRPPVRQSVLVRSDIRHTFDTFVQTIGRWWPVQVRAITVEPREGGRVFETWDDGTVVAWGELLAWQPPQRFVMTWTISTPVPTEVEFTFTTLGPALTRVAVEHRGWEALTDEQLREDCAAPGGYSSGGYATGWALVLERLATAAAP
jgi:Activator of Hsp90 ATPase homolog 1-like protein